MASPEVFALATADTLANAFANAAYTQRFGITELYRFAVLRGHFNQRSAELGAIILRSTHDNSSDVVNVSPFGGHYARMDRVVGAGGGADAFNLLDDGTAGVPKGTLLVPYNHILPCTFDETPLEEVGYMLPNQPPQTPSLPPPSRRPQDHIIVNL